MKWPSFLKPQNTTLSKPDDWLVKALLGSATASGVKVSPITAMSVPTVFACVNAVSRSMSSIPLKLYRRTANGGKEVAVDHPLYALIHDAPNPEMTSADFRRAVQANAVLRNSGYALIVRNGLGEVAELYPIPNVDIRPERDEKGVLFYYLKEKRVEADSILHVKGLTMNGVTGFDTISAVREAIGLAIALQDHGAKYFPNATTPSMTIEFPTNMSQQQLADFSREFDKHHTGAANSWKRMFLWGGAKLANRPQLNNEQAQFIEAKVYQDKAICQAFGVPQIKAGITDAAHYNNVEQENQNYVTDTLMSWAAQWEQTLNQKLLNPRERKKYFFEFSIDGLLRGDIASRYQAYQLAIQNGIMSRNEVRTYENLNPVEGGDRFVISQNVQLLDEAGMPLPPAEPATPDPAPAAPTP